jgi:FkbM family methyltransferase
MPKLIKFEAAPVHDAGELFAGLQVSNIFKVEWVISDDIKDKGVFWVAPVASDLYWVSDGIDRIAAAVPERIKRFLYRGVASRCLHLAKRYLNGLVPIQAGDTVINFGANIGEIALVIAGQGARVFAIEPDPGVLVALRANAAGRKIAVIEAAAWNKVEMLTLFQKTDTADTSVFNPSGRTIEVPAVTIDALDSTDIGIGDRIKLLIGDAEGAEPEVLEGARETLKKTEYVSVCASAERAGESTQKACLAILEDAGFDIIHKEDTKFCTLIGRNRTLS